MNVIIGVALYSCLLAPLSSAQTAKPLSIEDTLHARLFGEYSPVASSPDNKTIAYVSRRTAGISLTAETYPRTGVPARGMGADVFTMDVETGQEQNLTRSEGNNWHPVWSPDGRFLAFLSDRDGSGQARLWIWSAGTKAIRRISDLDARGDQITWMPDGENILMTCLPVGMPLEKYIQGYSAVSHNRAPEILPSPGSTVAVYEAERSASGSTREFQSDPWSINWALRDLELVNVATGKATLVIGGQHLAKYFLSPDGSHLVYTCVKRFEKPGSQQTLFDILSMDLPALKSQTIASDVPMGLGGEELTLSPDGSQLAYTTYGGTGAAFHIVDLSNASPREVSLLSFASRDARGLSRVPTWDKTSSRLYYIKQGALWNSEASGVGEHVVARIQGYTIVHLIPAAESSRIWSMHGDGNTVVIAQEDATKRDAFYQIDLTSGTSKKVLQSGSCFTCAFQVEQVTATKDGKRFYYFAESEARNSDIWMSGPDFENPKRLTRLNPQFDDYLMGRSQIIDWLSDDGERLHGALLLPAGYQLGVKYPLIVWVYGGSYLASQVNHFGLGFFGVFNMQLFATRGYAVLLPDSPQEEGRPLLDLAKTVLPGISKVVEMGVADPARIGVLGHSNGGFSVLGLIAQTKRFSAAVEMAGFADFIGAYGEMDKSGGAFGTSLYEHGQDGLGGTPWQFWERYVENSPLTYFDQIETPLLVVHGAEDPAVGSFLGDEVFVSLRRLGKEVEYAKYAGEVHSPLYWNEPNQIDVGNRMIGWFEKYLKKTSDREDAPSPSAHSNR
jgi:dipeptidyl aminopeptidase/acylaminoacyl peptidase